jgi:uncharacterized membrane protein YczE
MQIPGLPDPAISRLVRCVVGLGLFGAGIAFIIAADWGLGPWDVLHHGLSERTGIAIGTLIILVGAAAMVLWIPLRERPGWGTVINTIEIGLVVNLLEPRLGTFDSVPTRSAALIGGVVIVALGSGIYLGAGLGSGPRDGLMMGLERLGLSVRLGRTIIEATVLALGFLLGGSVGVGTLVFALGIGPLVQVFLPRFRLDREPTVPARARAR